MSRIRLPTRTTQRGRLAGHAGERVDGGEFLVQRSPWEAPTPTQPSPAATATAATAVVGKTTTTATATANWEI